MRTLVLSLLGVLGLGLATGCADVSESDDVSSAASSNLEAVTVWCLTPEGHPRNGNGPVWTIDVTSGFGPARDKLVERATGFYWHGPLLALTDEPPTSWLIKSVNQVDGYHAHAEGNDTSVDVDLSGDPDVGVGVTGTVSAVENGTATVTRIVAGRRCPTRASDVP
jgi:hypothetical protein